MKKAERVRKASGFSAPGIQCSEVPARARGYFEGANPIMMYFWVIPAILLAVVVLTLFFREGTKRNPAGPSRLDEAQDEDHG